MWESKNNTAFDYKFNKKKKHLSKLQNVTFQGEMYTNGFPLNG